MSPVCVCPFPWEGSLKQQPPPSYLDTQGASGQNPGWSSFSSSGQGRARPRSRRETQVLNKGQAGSG